MIFEGTFLGIGGGFLLSLLLAIGILVLGIILGKLVAVILSKIIKAVDIEKKVRPSFLNLIVVVIKWSIYIVFINLALNQLAIPQLSAMLTKSLIVVPALTAALVLIGIGFAIAIYLRDVIRDSEVTEWKSLSTYVYYFVLYVFGIYALNLALISIDALFKNILIVLLTAAVAIRMILSGTKNLEH
jgi:hypothetical protein